MFTTGYYNKRPPRLSFSRCVERILDVDPLRGYRRSSRRVRSGYLKRRRAGGVPRLRCRRKRPRQSRYTAQSPVRRPPGRTQRQRAASVLNQQSSVVVPACWLRSGLVLMLARERSLLVEDVVDVLRARPSSVSSMGIVFQDVVDVLRARRPGDSLPNRSR